MLLGKQPVSSVPQGDLETMTELAWRSAALFRKAGQPDSAAQLLERASQVRRENVFFVCGKLYCL